MSSYLDNFTNAYDEVFTFDNELMLNWYPERVNKLARGNSILELGLGHGFTAVKFLKRFERYLVVEGSAEVIKRFNAKFGESRIQVVRGYFEDFNTDERFDNIAMGFILEHVYDSEGILKKYQQFLAPNGSIFIIVPNGESLHRRFGHEAGLLNDMMQLSKADLDFGHQRMFNLQSLTTLVESCGYQIKVTEGIFLKPITTQQMIDLRLSNEILQAMLKVGVNYPELCNSILMEVTPVR